jgi:hypothetical protein
MRCGAGSQVKSKTKSAARRAGPPLRQRFWKSSLTHGSLFGITALLACLAWPALSSLVANPAETTTPAQTSAAKTKIKTAEGKTTTGGTDAKSEPGPRKTLPPLARPAGKLDPATLAQFIDKAIQHQLDTAKVAASSRSSDAEFLRRAYLDITGVIPPAEKVTTFVQSDDPRKRSRLIDELLASPLYGRRMADIWQAMLLPRNSDNRRLQATPLYDWLKDSFNQNRPWSQTATDLITASGTQEENGAVTFFIANPTPDKVTDTVTRLFLGVQLQCAQCHNHPFTSWTQTEYWAMAAFFSKVKMSGAAKKAAKKGAPVTVSENNNRKAGKKQKLPPSAKIVPAKFLQGAEPRLNKNAPYRPTLAKWLTAPRNPFFARAMVNRMWAHFFGRGFVNPVDDMHDQNQASHPLLLQVMAEQFAVNGFNVKDLVRAICNSETYQRTSKPEGANESDEILFSHMAIKVMSPEQMFDSLEMVVASQGKATAGRKNKNTAKANKKKASPNTPRAAFVAFFQIGEGADPTEYQSGIPQALRLMNSPQLSNANALLGKVLENPGQPPARVIEQLYLTTVSRPPTAQEAAKLTDYVRKQESGARKAYGDVLWALLNSSEFVLNH